MKFFLSILTMMMAIPQVMAQQGHADCSNALFMTETELDVNSLKGYGDELEVFGNSSDNAMFITEEHNTIWIMFTAPFSAQLTFDLVPEDARDNWNFMLFEAGPDFCEQINQKSIKALRSNLAENSADNGGKTGLNYMAVEAYKPAGQGDNYSSFLDVVGTKTYAMLIDIEDVNHRGFHLTLNYKLTEADVMIEESAPDNGSFEFVDMTDEASSDEMVTMNFEILNKATNEAINCQAHIVGFQWENEEMMYDSVSSFTASIPMGKWFYVNVKKAGFTFGTEKFEAKHELEENIQKIYLSEVKQGNKIVLNEIVFRENTTHLLPSSINALEQLIQFMNEYPTAEIEIQGHVNAPGFDNDGKVKKFSLKRAEQIKEYLVAEGIDGKRIEVKGMGNEHMIYPNPSNYDEEKANRRVEIEILSY